jgi:hypothetical protein
MLRHRKLLIVAGVLVATIVVLGVLVKRFMNRDRAPVVYADIQEHFKYGSIGTEKRLGVPAPLFDLFPRSQSITLGGPPTTPPDSALKDAEVFGYSSLTNTSTGRAARGCRWRRRPAAA